ncbi:MAG: endonuclease MutS2 [Clostridiaceae bacterium]|nr:endonuclease MutS2 [Clostridiaceae bacterium]
MTLQEKSWHTLELPQVLELLADQAISARGKELCREMRPAVTQHECERLQQQTADAVKLIGLQGSPSFYGLKDVSAALERAEKGGFLNPVELLAVAAMLKAARLTKAYREEKREEQTSLDEYFAMLAGNKYLEEKIENAIVSEEEISDHASPALYDVRRQIRTASAKVRDVLAKICSSQSNSKMLQDNIVTQRGGRFVVPVKSEFRGSFPGLVHDTSSSGATLFIEPAAVVELNNSIRVLTGKEQAEIERILAELSAEVAQFSSAIERDYSVLCSLDFIFARGNLAYNMKASRPELLERGRTELLRARHPLLNKDTAVPINFIIGGATDTVVITGPNTGGKTVSLKTLGLMTAMAQCGLFLPVGDGSRVVIRRSVFADIGDEQSIEQSLSTFSSHMTNIVEILQQADDGTLALLDELGAGTDPAEGAALATAIIEELRTRGSAVAATTHYAELKVYALETKGVENASCEFDVQTLRPTYRLIFGVPGKSNAFAISQRLGLPERIIASAQQRVDSGSREFEDVITRLEEKRQSLESKIDAAERQRRDAEEANRRAQERLETLEREREKLVLDAKLKAQEILSNAKAVSEHVLSEAGRLKQEVADGKDANLAAARAIFRGELTEAGKQVSAQRAAAKPMPLPRELKAGDTVEIVATHTRGTVLELPEKDGLVRVQAGILKIQVPISELQLVENAPKPKTKAKTTIHVTAPAQGSTSLDLRGQNGEEAVLELDRFLDNALRLRLETVTIIHGKGTGVLRQRVQAHLKNHPQVRSFRLGIYGEGEDGVTVVTMKL